MGIGTVVASYLKKMVIANNGGLAGLSAIVGVPLSIFSISLDKLFKDADYDKVIIPITAHVFFLIFYALFNFIDFATGIRAAKKECELKLGRKASRREYVDMDRVLDTMWKFFTIILITTMVTATIYICVASQVLNWFYVPLMIVLVVLWFIANGYEFISIGDNIKRRTGKMPKVFTRFEKVLDKVSEKAIDKLDDSSFGKM